MPVQSKEKQWRPVEPPSSTLGVYFDDPKPDPHLWTYKLPAWMTEGWPEADEVDENESWWPTLAICVMALLLVVVSLQPWTWQ